jgi:hypothetical protein
MINSLGLFPLAKTMTGLKKMSKSSGKIMPGRFWRAKKSKTKDENTMSAATFYFLVALLAGDSPALSGLAGYDSLEACQAAADSITETLASGSPTVQLVCLSGDALQNLAATSK